MNLYFFSLISFIRFHYVYRYIYIVTLHYIYFSMHSFSLFLSLPLYPIKFLVHWNFEFHWFIVIAYQPIIFEIHVFGVPQRHLLNRAYFDKFRVSIVSTVTLCRRYINSVKKLFISIKEGKKLYWSMIYTLYYVICVRRDLCDSCSKRFVCFVLETSCVPCVKRIFYLNVLDL